MAKVPHSQSVPDRVLQLCMTTLSRLAEGYSYDREALPVSDITHIAHAVMLTIFRYRASLDWMIDRLGRGRIRPRLRRTLWCGLAQLAYMKGVEKATVVDTCVRFVNRRFNRREGGFINAILREFIRRGPDSLPTSLGQKVPPHVSHNLDPFLYQRWQELLPPEQLRTLTDLLLTPAPLIVRLRKQEKGLQLAHLRPLPSPPWVKNTELFLCLEPRAFLATEQFAAGHFYIQDPSTLLAPAMLDPKSEEHIADLCASPGGKALLLAENMPETGTLFCLDRSRRRMTRLRENLRDQARCCFAVGDAALPPLPSGLMDAILLDVPCTNTGVIRRHPDIRWRFSQENLSELTQLQAGILDGAAPSLRPGGKIVYSTCSLEPEENHQQISTFLSKHPDFCLVKEKQLFPDQYHDGAYAALLRKHD